MTAVSRKFRPSAQRRRSQPCARRGALLLIVMALLSLLTLLGLTLVVATSQGRMSAIAAARTNAEADRSDSAMDEVLNQILRGTHDSDSVLQAHSLLEDKYGPPQLYGRVGSPSGPGPADVTPIAGGQILQINATASTGFTLAPWNGAYCGQVITMIDGEAQGISSRVVGYVYVVGPPAYGIFQVVSFDGLLPRSSNGTYLGDQFVINGRPFSGTGFGFNLANGSVNTATSPPTPTSPPLAGPLLNAIESTSTDTNKPAPTSLPYALLPNHAQLQLSPAGTPPYYIDPAGPGGANESYDAVDFQNMLLAMHLYQAPNNNVALPNNGVITPIPSLHRPELVAWHAQQNGSALPLNVRRKVILRPEPLDHGNTSYSFREPWVDLPSGFGLPGNGKYNPGEPFLDLNGDNIWTAGDLDFSGNQFNPITGCWYIDASDPNPANIVWRRDPNVTGGLDVDNDNDGIPDSIWVDVGLPVKTKSDGSQYKTLAAILCVDMDGKINLNAHGAPAQLDPNRYFNTVQSPILGPFTNTSAGSLAPEASAGQRNFPIGQGYGPAEINPAYLLARMINGTGGQVDANTLTYFANLMMGYAYVDYSTTPNTFHFAVDGKYGEASRVYMGSADTGLYPPSPYNGPVLSPANGFLGATFAQFLLGGPRPGASRWIDPYMTGQTATNAILNPSKVSWDWVNDAITLARMSDIRPSLLTPAAQIAYPNFRPGHYFDFVTPNFGVNGSSLPYENLAIHVQTSHGSPYDLHARGVVATDLRGQPYFAGTQTLPWMSASANGNNFLSDPTPSLSTAPSMGPLQDAYLSYLNDAVDSPYELDLSPAAQHTGKATGAGQSTIDSPFTPAELEGILRAKDSGVGALRTRLDSLEMVYQNRTSPTPLPPIPSSTTASSLTDDKVRLSVTTESWDPPVPSIALTPQQMTDIAWFNAQGGPQLSYNGLSVADLARTRIFAENNGNPAYATTNTTAADLTLFGNVNGNATVAASGAGVWPLLAPDVIMGLRLDINRLLGNGIDDNLNGVVDEPTEAFWLNGAVPQGEALAYPWSAFTGTNGVQNPQTGMNTIYQLLDLNNDGLYPTDGTNVLTDPLTGNFVALNDPTMADTRARQLLARHLYVMMMLLLDDRNIQAQVFTSVNGLSSPWPQTGSLTKPEQAAYVIAQWAVNVVDFRDRDSISTPFEFDLHPFYDDDAVAGGTWDVDDMIDPAIGALTGSRHDDSAAHRGLVWGCERPELLLTETIATHDRGTDDTTSAKNLPSAQGGGADTLYDNTMPTMKDQTYDQVRRPRGSLLVEVFNPNSPLDPPQGDMNSAYAISAGVNLTQRAQIPNTTVASPVWRLAVAYSSANDDSSTYAGKPTTMVTLDPRVPVLPPSYIHRVAYFAPLNPVAGAGTVAVPNNNVTEVSSGRSFYADMNLVTGPVIVPPNSYALIGPGTVNPSAGGITGLYFGQRSTGSQANNYKSAVNFGTAPNFNNAQLVDTSGGAATPIAPFDTSGAVNIKAVAGLPLATLALDSSAAPTSSASPNTTLRFSISEPEVGYPLWPTVGGTNWDDGFYQTPYPNTPFDDPNNTFSDFTTAPSPQINPNPKIAPDGTHPFGTIENYTTVYLQRLANPLVPWDQYANPYITVDSMPVDLTAYTGEYSGDGTTGGTEPAYQGASPSYSNTSTFDTRQRGDANDTKTANAPNLWSTKTTAASGLTGATSSLTAPLTYSTPGFLNRPYWWDPTNTTMPPATWDQAFYSPANTTWYAKLTALQGGSLAVPASQYLGDPLAPFPWLTWLNRPYVSQYELALVPASSPSSLLADFGMLGWNNGGSALSQYSPGAGSSGQLPIAQFKHLLNYFNTEQGGSSVPNLYRIFEYIHVPSRFAGTQEMLTPAAMDSDNTGAIPHFFHPPFNWLSSYREPGRVNLNTVFDQRVFEGLMDAYPGWSTLWQTMTYSRQGASNALATSVVPNWGLHWNPNPLNGAALNPVYPTFFANPFRPDGAGALVPQTLASDPTKSIMMHPWNYPGAGANFGVNTTLLRSVSADPVSNATGLANATTALFDAQGFEPAAIGKGYVFNQSNAYEYRDAGRNAYFQYQPLQRLGNLVTNRSNVYAIWITLGKFEVSRVPISATNRDGYQLVKEIGSDTGQIERQRGFYLIDRSIPVGFSRGHNLNVERTVLIERILDN